MAQHCQYGHHDRHDRHDPLSASMNGLHPALNTAEPGTSRTTVSSHPPPQLFPRSTRCQLPGQTSLVTNQSHNRGKPVGGLERGVFFAPASIGHVSTSVWRSCAHLEDKRDGGNIAHGSNSDPREQKARHPARSYSRKRRRSQDPNMPPPPPVASQPPALFPTNDTPTTRAARPNGNVAYFGNHGHHAYLSAHDIPIYVPADETFVVDYDYTVNSHQPHHHQNKLNDAGFQQCHAPIAYIGPPGSNLPDYCKQSCIECFRCDHSYPNQPPPIDPTLLPTSVAHEVSSESLGPPHKRFKPDSKTLLNRSTLKETKDSSRVEDKGHRTDVRSVFLLTAGLPLVYMSPDQVVGVVTMYSLKQRNVYESLIISCHFPLSVLNGTKIEIHNHNEGVDSEKLQGEVFEAADVPHGVPEGHWSGKGSKKLRLTVRLDTRALCKTILGDPTRFTRWIRGASVSEVEHVYKAHVLSQYSIVRDGWLERHPGLIREYFPILCNWLVELHFELFKVMNHPRRLRCQSPLNPVHLATIIVYNFLEISSSSYTREMLQLVGVAAYAIALTLQYPDQTIQKTGIKASVLAYYTDDAYTPEQVNQAIINIKQTINTHGKYGGLPEGLSFVTPSEVLKTLIGQMQRSNCLVGEGETKEAEGETKEPEGEAKDDGSQGVPNPEQLVILLANYMVDLSMHDITFSLIPPNHTAASALLNAYQIAGLVCGPKALEVIGIYSNWTNLDLITRRLLDLFHCAQGHETTRIRWNLLQRILPRHPTVIRYYSDKLKDWLVGGFDTKERVSLFKHEL